MWVGSLVQNDIFAPDSSDLDSDVNLMCSQQLYFLCSCDLCCNVCLTIRHHIMVRGLKKEFEKMFII